MSRIIDIGTIAFIIYCVLNFFLKLPKTITIYVALITLIMIPFLLVIKLETFVENIAVFGFCLLLLIAVQTLVELKKEINSPNAH